MGVWVSGVGGRNLGGQEGPAVGCSAGGWVWVCVWAGGVGGRSLADRRDLQLVVQQVGVWVMCVCGCVDMWVE